MSKTNKQPAAPGPNAATGNLDPRSLEERIKAAQGKSSYVPDEDERHLYHVKMDRPAFDPTTGERKGAKPFKQKFTVQDWRNHLEHGAQLGYITEVIWNPELYAGANEAPEQDPE